MKLIFCMQINIKLSYRLILLILMGMARHAQITRKSKFAKSFLTSQKKKWGMKSSFCADQQSFLKIDAIIFDGHLPGMTKVLKITCMHNLCNILWSLYFECWQTKFFTSYAIIFYGVSLACPNYPGKCVRSLGHLKKEVRNDVYIIHPVFSHYWIFSFLIWNPYQAFPSFD